MHRGYLFRVGEIEVTLREILLGFLILAIFTGLGTLLSGFIFNSRQDRLQEFRKRVQVESASEFAYCKETGVGGFIAEDTLFCLDPVEISDIPGSYMKIKKVKERYTRHTRTVTTSNGKGQTRTHVQVYYTWDPIKSWSWEAKRLEFLGQSISVGIPGTEYLTTIKESAVIRYKYYGTPTKVPGVLEGTIADEKEFEGLGFAPGGSIEGVEKALERSLKTGPTIFWIFWGLLTVVSIIFFYRGEYDWLERN